MGTLVEALGSIKHPTTFCPRGPIRGFRCYALARVNRALLLSFGFVGATAAVVACGASVSQKYESDVRFERCYALDWKKDVDAGIRSRCWDEWLTQFSNIEGQPRDRIDYAKRQTSGAVLLVSADPSGSAAAPPVSKPLPEPTNAFSPVPMMATPGATASASASASAPATRSTCATRCDRTLEACLSGCGSGACEKFCTQKHGKCETKCAATEKK